MGGSKGEFVGVEWDEDEVGIGIGGDVAHVGGRLHSSRIRVQKNRLVRLFLGSLLRFVVFHECVIVFIGIEASSFRGEVRMGRAFVGGFLRGWGNGSGRSGVIGRIGVNGGGWGERRRVLVGV